MAVYVAFVGLILYVAYINVSAVGYNFMPI